MVTVNLDQVEPLDSRDDLIETGVSFSRPREGEIAAEDGSGSVEVTIRATTLWLPLRGLRANLGPPRAP